MSSTHPLRLRVALFGTPAFALPTLDMLAREHALLLVVAQPDRKAGRGHALSAPPVAERARELGVELWQPERLRRDTALHERMRALHLDVAITAAYGQILTAEVLAIPAHGFMNVHGSLLPRWRGAAPVQRALMAGDTLTGISIMQTELGLDTGPVRLQRQVSIGPAETASALMHRLAQLGADTLAEALTLLAQGALPSTPQDDALATQAPRLAREDGRIRWTAPATAIVNRHRGVQPWPGSWCTGTSAAAATAGAASGDGIIKVHALSAIECTPTSAPGTILAIAPEGVRVACALGCIRLEQLQRAGKPRSDAFAFALGAHWKVGDALG